MCQPKPGPRCTAHARAALTAARTARTAATERFEAAKAAIAEARRRPVGYHANQADPDRAAEYRAAMDAKFAAERAYDHALRDYETTPAGQKALATAIERLAADGDLAGSEAARARLEEAAATRARQVADLAASRVQAERLANMSEDERAAVAELDAAVSRAADAHDLAKNDLTTFVRAEMEHEDAARAVDDAQVAAFRAERDAQDQVVAAQEIARREARRLYQEAGVSDRYAGYYADDTLLSAMGVNPHSMNVNGTETARRSLTLKAKRTGPDAATTAAAKAAAATDAGFVAANSALAEKVAAHRAATEARQRLQTNPDTEAVMQRRAQLRRYIAAADDAVGQAQAAHTQAVGVAQRARARIAAGAGITATPVDLTRATDEFVRQPDGSTNAYVYRQPSAGFPNGRYARVTGVTTVQGMGAANALVLDDGSTVHASESYSRGRNGATLTRSAPVEVIVTPAAPGAHPLRSEAVGGAGFSTYVDTTD